MLAPAFSMPYQKKKKKKRERKREEEKRARQAERSRRKLSNGSRLTSQYSIDERATFRQKKVNSRGRAGGREKEREGEGDRRIIDGGLDSAVSTR